MTDQKQNLQDTFLNYLRKNKTPTTVFLVNGVKLQGIVTWFDNFSVLLRREAHSQLIYKHAISTVMPNVPVQMFEGSNERRHAFRTPRDSAFTDIDGIRHGDRALVLKPILKTGGSHRDPEPMLAEAVGLAQAINLIIVHAAVVNVAHPAPATLLGKGQVEHYRAIDRREKHRARGGRSCAGAGAAA